MKELSFSKKGERFHPVKYWEIDGSYVAIYQGARGDRPDLDFVVKYKESGKRLRTPSHTHWIVDLLVKAEYDSETLSEYVTDLIEIYDEVHPFETQEERLNYTLVYPEQMNLKYQNLNGHGYYCINTLTTFIELFSLCEKRSKGAFMFRSLLNLIKSYCEGTKDFYQVVGYSKRV